MIVSIIGIIGLSLSGMPMVSKEFSHTEAFSDGSFVSSGGFRLHWPLVALLASAVTGLLLLLIRKQEKMNT